MKFKPLLRALIRSFHDPAQYREALQEWKGFGGVYASLVSAISAAVMTIALGMTIAMFISVILPSLMDKIPEVVVTKGEVAVKLPKTYQDKGNKDAFEVELPDGQRIIIDPKRERKYYETTDDVFIGVGHDFMTIRTDKGVRTTEFSKADTFTISAETIKKAFDRYNAGYLLLVFPIIFVGQLMIYLISMVATSVISFAITAFMRKDYDFNARLRLSALALTPGVTLSTLMMFLGHRTGPWFAPLVAALYIYAMIMLMRKQSASTSSR